MSTKKSKNKKKRINRSIPSTSPSIPESSSLSSLTEKTVDLQKLRQNALKTIKINPIEELLKKTKQINKNNNNSNKIKNKNNENDNSNKNEKELTFCAVKTIHGEITIYHNTNKFIKRNSTAKLGTSNLCEVIITTDKIIIKKIVLKYPIENNIKHIWINTKSPIKNTMEINKNHVLTLSNAITMAFMYALDMEISPKTMEDEQQFFKDQIHSVAQIVLKDITQSNGRLFKKIKEYSTSFNFNNLYKKVPHGKWKPILEFNNVGYERKVTIKGKQETEFGEFEWRKVQVNPTIEPNKHANKFPNKYKQQVEQPFKYGFLRLLMAENENENKNNEDYEDYENENTNKTKNKTVTFNENIEEYKNNDDNEQTNNTNNNKHINAPLINNSNNGNNSTFNININVNKNKNKNKSKDEISDNSDEDEIEDEDIDIPNKDEDEDEDIDMLNENETLTQQLDITHKKIKNNDNGNNNNSNNNDIDIKTQTINYNQHYTFDNYLNQQEMNITTKFRDDINKYGIFLIETQCVQMEHPTRNALLQELKDIEIHHLLRIGIILITWLMKYPQIFMKIFEMKSINIFCITYLDEINNIFDKPENIVKSNLDEIMLNEYEQTINIIITNHQIGMINKINKNIIQQHLNIQQNQLQMETTIQKNERKSIRHTYTEYTSTISNKTIQNEPTLQKYEQFFTNIKQYNNEHNIMYDIYRKYNTLTLQNKQLIKKLVENNENIKSNNLIITENEKDIIKKYPNINKSTELKEYNTKYSLFTALRYDEHSILNTEAIQINNFTNGYTKGEIMEYIRSRIMLGVLYKYEFLGKLIQTVVNMDTVDTDEDIYNTLGVYDVFENQIKSECGTKTYKFNITENIVMLKNFEFIGILKEISSSNGEKINININEIESYYNNMIINKYETLTNIATKVLDVITINSKINNIINKTILEKCELYKNDEYKNITFYNTFLSEVSLNLFELFTKGIDALPQLCNMANYINIVNIVDAILSVIFKHYTIIHQYEPKQIANIIYTNWYITNDVKNKLKIKMSNIKQQMVLTYIAKYNELIIQEGYQNILNNKLIINNYQTNMEINIESLSIIKKQIERQQIDNARKIHLTNITNNFNDINNAQNESEIIDNKNKQYNNQIQLININEQNKNIINIDESDDESNNNNKNNNDIYDIDDTIYDDKGFSQAEYYVRQKQINWDILQNFKKRLNWHTEPIYNKLYEENNKQKCNMLVIKCDQQITLSNEFIHIQQPSITITKTKIIQTMWLHEFYNNICNKTQNVDIVNNNNNRYITIMTTTDQYLYILITLLISLQATKYKVTLYQKICNKGIITDCTLEVKVNQQGQNTNITNKGYNGNKYNGNNYNGNNHSSNNNNNNNNTEDLTNYTKYKKRSRSIENLNRNNNNNNYNKNNTSSYTKHTIKKQKTKHINNNDNNNNIDTTGRTFWTKLKNDVILTIGEKSYTTNELTVYNTNGIYQKQDAPNDTAKRVVFYGKPIIITLTHINEDAFVQDTQKSYKNIVQNIKNALNKYVNFPQSVSFKGEYLLSKATLLPNVFKDHITIALQPLNSMRIPLLTTIMILVNNNLCLKRLEVFIALCIKQLYRNDKLCKYANINNKYINYIIQDDKQANKPHEKRIDDCIVELGEEIHPWSIIGSRYQANYARVRMQRRNTNNNNNNNQNFQ